MKISDLLKYESVIYIDPRLDTEKELKIATDPKECDEDSLLFFSKKVGRDTYNLPTFKDHGPYAIVCEWDTEELVCETPLVRVNNVRWALASSYSEMYEIDYQRMKLVGITGTNGKTSTATMLYSILRDTGKNIGLIGTGIIKINDNVVSDDYHSMTTPDPSELYKILGKMKEFGCEYVVMEVSSHAISLSKVAPIKFECGIFTNLSPEHMDFHKDMEEYYRTKLSLFKQCKNGIFNMDDIYSRRAYDSVSCAKHSVGVINKAEAYATEIMQNGLNGSSFYYREKSLIFKQNLQLPGAYNIYNALMALKCAITLGIKPCLAKKALSELSGIEGRMEIIENDITVIIDYAHTPFALENLLKTLNSCKNIRQKLIVVFGCGGNRDKSKRPIMGEISSRCADTVIITEDNNRGEKFEDIATDIISGMKDDTHFTKIADRRAAITYAILGAKRGDIIAVVGKGHEKYKIDSEGYHRFDEREIISAALEKRRDRDES